MTPEQEAALRRIVTAHYGVLVSGHLADEVVAAARVLVANAVAAEREACAATARFHARREQEHAAEAEAAGLQWRAAECVASVCTAETIAAAIEAGGELADTLAPHAIAAAVAAERARCVRLAEAYLPAAVLAELEMEQDPESPAG